jgi:hypothetical protein
LDPISGFPLIGARSCNIVGFTGLRLFASAQIIRNCYTIASTTAYITITGSTIGTGARPFTIVARHPLISAPADDFHALGGWRLLRRIAETFIYDRFIRTLTAICSGACRIDRAA